MVKKAGLSVPNRSTRIEIQDLERSIRDKSAEEILRWAIETYGEGIALSFKFWSRRRGHN